MTRNNVLYLVIGALAVAAAVLGYQVYQDRTNLRACTSMSGQAGCLFKANELHQGEGETRAYQSPSS